MITSRFRTVLFVLFAIVSAEAGGPVYSRYGIGDILWFGSSRAWAMGGPGFALRGEGFINMANPAGLSGLLRTRFDGSFGYTSTSSEQGGGNSVYGAGGLQNFAIAIPIDVARGIVLAIGTAPYSAIGYSVRKDDVQSGVASTQFFYGRGGLSAISLGLSASVMPQLHVGLRGEYLYGRVRQLTRIDFQNVTFVDDEVDRSGFYRGLQLTAGGILELPNAIPGIPIAVGITATLPGTATVEQNDVFTALDTVLQTTGDATLPFRLGMGAAARVGDRTNVIVDASYEGWSGAKVFGTVQPELRNALRFSAGIEFLPRTGDVTYLQRLGYRLGAGAAQTYVQLNGVGINDVFATAGVSFPIGPDARLNLGLQYGIRGTTDAGLQKDTYVRLSLGFSASELWFVNFEED
ncbi:MAG: hypothetical protein AABY75_02205 [Bacteroidota bacterium]